MIKYVGLIQSFGKIGDSLRQEIGRSSNEPPLGFSRIFSRSHLYGIEPKASSMGCIEHGGQKRRLDRQLAPVVQNQKLGRCRRDEKSPLHWISSAGLSSPLDFGQAVPNQKREDEGWLVIEPREAWLWIDQKNEQQVR